jgi:hypothetical protein
VTIKGAAGPLRCGSKFVHSCGGCYWRIVHHAHLDIVCGLDGLVGKPTGETHLLTIFVVGKGHKGRGGHLVYSGENIIVRGVWHR